MSIAKTGKAKGSGGAVDYVFKDDKNAEKKPEIIGGNVTGTNKKEIKTEFREQEKLNNRAKNTITHISVSFPKEKEISNEDAADYADAMVKKIGYEKNPYLVVRHFDKEMKDNEPFAHIHIVASRINDDGSLIPEWKIAERTIAAAKEIDREFGLESADYVRLSAKEKQDRNIKKDEFQLMRRTAHLSVLEEFKDTAEASLAKRGNLREFVTDIQKAGYEVLPNISDTTGKMNGFSFAKDEIIFTASKAGKQYKWANLAKETNFQPESDTKFLQNLKLAVKANKDLKAEVKTYEKTGERADENHLGEVDGKFRSSGSSYEIGRTEPSISTERDRKIEKSTEFAGEDFENSTVANQIEQQPEEDSDLQNKISHLEKSSRIESAQSLDEIKSFNSETAESGFDENSHIAAAGGSESGHIEEKTRISVENSFGTANSTGAVEYDDSKVEADSDSLQRSSDGNEIADRGRKGSNDASVRHYRNGGGREKEIAADNLEFEQRIGQIEDGDTAIEPAIERANRGKSEGVGGAENIKDSERAFGSNGDEIEETRRFGQKTLGGGSEIEPGSRITSAGSLKENSVNEEHLRTLESYQTGDKVDFHRDDNAVDNRLLLEIEHESSEPRIDGANRGIDRSQPKLAETEQPIDAGEEGFGGRNRLAEQIVPGSQPIFSFVESRAEQNNADLPNRQPKAKAVAEIVDIQYFGANLDGKIKEKLAEIIDIVEPAEFLKRVSESKSLEEQQKIIESIDEQTSLIAAGLCLPKPVPLFESEPVKLAFKTAQTEILKYEEITNSKVDPKVLEEMIKVRSADALETPDETQIKLVREILAEENLSLRINNVSKLEAETVIAVFRPQLIELELSEIQSVERNIAVNIEAAKEVAALIQVAYGGQRDKFTDEFKNKLAEKIYYAAETSAVNFYDEWRSSDWKKTVNTFQSIVDETAEANQIKITAPPSETERNSLLSGFMVGNIVDVYKQQMPDYQPNTDTVKEFNRQYSLLAQIPPASVQLERIQANIGENLNPPVFSNALEVSVYNLTKIDEAKLPQIAAAAVQSIESKVNETKLTEDRQPRKFDFDR